MNGIINVYKEKGYTSFDVVAKLRKLLMIKSIGHTGTLDPDAEGVLPVCIGNAVKLCELLSEKDKAYEAVIKLGIVTDTQDMSGKVIKEQPLFIKKDTFIEAVYSFSGEYKQLPPMYSAIKINGKKLYEYAREGIEIERPARNVKIHSIDITDIREENGYVVEAVLTVECSKGTYIRTLCHDIGEKLSQGACMKKLLRTRAGIFLLENGKKFCDLEHLLQNGRIEEAIIPVEDILTFRSLVIDENYNKYLFNGNKLRPEQIAVTSQNLDNPSDSELFKVYDHLNKFVAIYRYDNSEMLYYPYKMFL